MMASKNHCKVEVTWESSSSTQIEDIVIYNIESDTYDECNKIQSSDGVDLYLLPPKVEKDEKFSPCNVTITCLNPMDNLAIAAVDILSNARNIEVFSPSGEYLITAEGIKLDVAGERKLYLSQHTFDQAQAKCSLRFVSLTEPKKLWLHSLHITLGYCNYQGTSPFSLGPSINMDKVNSLLAEMDGINIPDKAKELMSTISYQQKAKEKNVSSIGSFLGNKDGPPTMSSLMGMFSTMNLMGSLGTNSSSSSSSPRPTHESIKEAENPTLTGQATGKSKKSKNKKKKKGKNTDNQDNKTETNKVESNKTQNKSEKSNVINQKIVTSDKRDTAKKTCALPKTCDVLDEKPSQQNPQNNKKKKKKQKQIEAQKKVDKSKVQESSGSSDSNETQGTSTCSTTSITSSAGSSKDYQDLHALEERLSAKIKASENLLIRHINMQLAASEKRITDHMNNLVAQMATVFIGGFPKESNGTKGK